MNPTHLENANLKKDWSEQMANKLPTAKSTATLCMELAASAFPIPEKAGS